MVLESFGVWPAVHWQSLSNAHFLSHVTIFLESLAKRLPTRKACVSLPNAFQVPIDVWILLFKVCALRVHENTVLTPKV